MANWDIITNSCDINEPKNCDSHNRIINRDPQIGNSDWQTNFQMTDTKNNFSKQSISPVKMFEDNRHYYQQHYESKKYDSSTNLKTARRHSVSNTHFKEQPLFKTPNNQGNVSN